MSHQFNLESRDKLVCPDCGHVLAIGFESSSDTVMALSITALILLLLSISFPFMAFDANGQANSIMLLAPVTQLHQFEFSVLSLFVLAFIVILPCLYLLALLCLTLAAKWSLDRHYRVMLARLVTRILPWAMADVFIFGVLVAMIKITSMASVDLGVSFWAYILFTLLFLRITSIVDTHRLWGWVADEH